MFTNEHQVVCFKSLTNVINYTFILQKRHVFIIDFHFLMTVPYCDLTCVFKRQLICELRRIYLQTRTQQDRKLIE